MSVRTAGVPTAFLASGSPEAQNPDVEATDTAELFKSAWCINEVIPAAGERLCLAEDWVLKIGPEHASIWRHFTVHLRPANGNTIVFLNWVHNLTGGGPGEPPMKQQLQAFAVLTGPTHWVIEGDTLIIENNAGDRVTAQRHPLDWLRD
jgi:hypothetical protein